MSEENRCLFIRHLPSEWRKEDVDKLFSHLVPATVLNHDERKKTSVVEFPDEATARNMMNSLHQFEIGGRRLVVEFARKADLVRSCSEKEGKPRKEGEEEGESTVSSYLRRWQAFLQSLSHVSEKWDLKYSSSSSLRYFYPPPSPTVLKNILIAVNSYPRFYTQVLHLMNKMHLPCPFDGEFPVPDLMEDIFSKPAEVERDIESDESELVSSGEDASKNKTIHRSSRHRKRPIGQIRLTAAKRMRAPPTKPSAPSVPVSEVFESSSTSAPRHIDIRIPSDPSVTVQEIPLPTEGGFGVIEPSVGPEKWKQDEEEEEKEEVPDGILSPHTLSRGRLSQKEMLSLPVFKRYEAGEPSQRLYVKNVARGVSEEELKAVFGAFVRWRDEQEKETFHVQLLTSGRMKGQAFVTLASEDAAKKALEAVNGFVMKDKPLVVQFARAAKAKPDEKSLLADNS